MNIFRFVFFILYLLPLMTSGQTNRVKLTEPAVIHLNAHEKIIAELKFTIDSGFHIMSDNPGEENLIPTTFKLKPVKEIDFGLVEFPPSHVFKIEGTQNSFNVFDNAFSIQIPVSKNNKTTHGKFETEGVLFYQACDYRKCYFPKELRFPVTIIVK